MDSTNQQKKVTENNSKINIKKLDAKTCRKYSYAEF